MYPENQQPIASAGSYQPFEATGPDNTEVQFNAYSSYDLDGDELTYLWAWDGGSAIGALPSIQLPIGVHEITLIVNDGQEDSEPDITPITVQDTISPDITITGIKGGADYTDSVKAFVNIFDSGSGVVRVHAKIT